MSGRTKDRQPQDVSEFKKTVQVTLTVAAAGNYTAGDILSNSATGDAGVAKEIELYETFGTMEIAQIVMKCDEDSLTFRPRYHFYNYNPVAADVEMDDNAAADFAKITAGRDGYLGAVTGGAFADRGTAMSVSVAELVNFLLRTKAGSSKVYMVLETLDDEANETAGMTFTIDIYFR